MKNYKTIFIFLFCFPLATSAMEEQKHQETLQGSKIKAFSMIMLSASVAPMVYMAFGHDPQFNSGDSPRSDERVVSPVIESLKQKTTQNQQEPDQESDIEIKLEQKQD